MKKILLNFDKFSKEFHLTYKGKGKLLTEFGGILTITAIIIILLDGFLIGKDVIYKENPTVLTYEKNFDYSPATRINYNNMFFGISVSTLKGDLEDDSIYKVIPFYEIHFYNKYGTLKHKRKILNLIDCNQLNLSNPLISPSYKQRVKCIDPIDFILSGSWKENPVLNLNLQVLTCKNESTVSIQDSFNDEDRREILEKITNFTLSNQLELNPFKKESSKKLIEIFNNSIYSTNDYSLPMVNCKSKEEIDQTIPNLFFNFFYNKISFNSKNYTNPVNSQGDTIWVRLGNSLYKELVFKFNHYILTTDIGLFFNQPSNEQINIGFQQVTKDYNSKNPDDNLLLEVQIYISNNVKYLNRGYIKIQTIFANLGGMMKLVFFIFQILYDPFFNKKLRLKFVNKIFEFDEENINKNFENIKKSEYYNQNKNIPKMTNQILKQEKSIIFKYESSSSGRNNLKNHNKNYNKKNKNYYIKENLNDIMNFTNNIHIKNNDSKIMDLNNTSLKVINKEHQINDKISVEKTLKEKKLKYQNLELLKDLYCRCICKNKLLDRKNQFFNWASDNLFEYTDFLNNIKIHRDILKLKYFIFNNSQLKSFEFINNPKKFQNQILHHDKEFAEICLIGKDKAETVTEIVQYFKERIKLNKLEDIDKKLLRVIDNEFINLILEDI